MKKQTMAQGAMDRFNTNIQGTAMRSRLVQGEGGLEWRFDDLTCSFNAMLWPIARAAAELLASPDLAGVRACSSSSCQWLFLDTSKNHHRRWCSMKECGNRAKVRKFYARRRAAG